MRDNRLKTTAEKYRWQILLIASGLAVASLFYLLPKGPEFGMLWFLVAAVGLPSLCNYCFEPEEEETGEAATHTPPQESMYYDPRD